MGIMCVCVRFLYIKIYTYIHIFIYIILSKYKRLFYVPEMSVKGIIDVDESDNNCRM